MFLEGLGYTTEFKQIFGELAEPTHVPGRVARAALDHAQA